MSTIIVWYRNDLRLHDHPALATAIEDADTVIPLFIFDKKIYAGRNAGSNRNRFLLQSLDDLRQQLQAKGGNLIIRDGAPEDVLLALAQEFGAKAVYYTADFTPYAIQRDVAVKRVIGDNGIEFRSFPGRLIVSSLDKLSTASGSPYKVFTPFYKSWLKVGRRAVTSPPQHIKLPSNIAIGSMPLLTSITKATELSPDALPGGETAARQRLKTFLMDGLEDYIENNNNMGIDSTSRLSSYLHFGCISPLEIESMLSRSDGARAWRRQLAWADFYNYVLYKFPTNKHHEFQERYRNLHWGQDKRLLKTWVDGKTGYPIVDAAMRQIAQEGWMHNRARLIVGSFLTKDLWLDWRLGEAYFMKMLTDGDNAVNNGNWQWIASVGVDPAPVFRRLYNPSSQQQKYDPDGLYIKKYLPELRNVPVKYLNNPERMTAEEQKEYSCVIGTDYPKPVVNHADARQAALEHYRSMR